MPPHWHRGAFIGIFVRAWKHSGGDGIGNLRGLRSTLDHLQDLAAYGRTAPEGRATFASIHDICAGLRLWHPPPR